MTRSTVRSVVAKLFPGRGGPPPRYIETDEGIAWRVHNVRRGGMGIVYLCSLATGDEGGEPARAPAFALKTFDDRYFFDLEMRRAVEAEGSLWMRVSDLPGILPLLGLQNARNKPHLLMPAVTAPAGEPVTLADLIRAHPQGLPPDYCLQTAISLALTLRACQQRIAGLVHGDVKPENILLLGGHPHLADFGAAHLRLHRSEAPRGTAFYLAPESWLDGEITPSADLYAFGATLFEMLEGRTPFSARSPERLKELHLRQQPRFSRPPRDELERALQGFALHCLEKDPGDRPADIFALCEALLVRGQELDPISQFMSMAKLAESVQIFRDPKILVWRLTGLLERRDGETACHLLDTIAPEELQGDVLRLAASAHSLANRDEEALDLFQRYLDQSPPADRKWLALNEMGLSLKRLGRLAQARTLYEEALKQEAPEHEVLLKGNYAATLIAMGDADRALAVLSKLSRRHPDSPETWGLLADARRRTGKPEEAVEAIQRAIRLRPEDGSFRVALAALLMDHFRDIPGAQEALEVAFQLNYHSAEWIRRTLACFMLVDDRAQLADLTTNLSANAGPETAERLFEEAIELARRIAAGPVEAEGAADAAEDDDPGTAGPPSATADTEPPARDEQELRQAIRDGVQPHLQMRMSGVDGSIAYDFYLSPDSPGFEDTFSEAIRSVAEVQPDEMALRIGPFWFARCPECAAAMLTNRDVGESYRCQGCEERVVATPWERPDLPQLATAAAAAAGLKTVAAAAEALIVAVWSTGDQAPLSELFGAAGYERIPEGRAAYEHVAVEAHQRGMDVADRILSVWLLRSPPADAKAGGDGTPAHLDRLLRNLRRLSGMTISLSLNASEDILDLLMSDPATQLARLQSMLRDMPGDLQLRRTAVDYAVRTGFLDDAEAIAKEAARLSPDDPDTRAALGAVARARGEMRQAVELLEPVLVERPNDQLVRMQLMTAYEALGEKERAEQIRRQLLAHGFA